jgi:hypothetical protein
MLPMSLDWQTFVVMAVVLGLVLLAATFLIVA